MGIADELERLQALRERGALSPEEFERAKAHVLAQETWTGPAGTPGANSAADANAAAGANPPPEANFGAGANSAAGDNGAGAARSFFRQLARSPTDRLLGGVCGGLGRHTDLPSWAWRLIFCLVALYFGAGVVFYLLLWIFLPLEGTVH